MMIEPEHETCMDKFEVLVLVIVLSSIIGAVFVEFLI